MELYVHFPELFPTLFKKMWGNFPYWWNLGGGPFSRIVSHTFQKNVVKYYNKEENYNKEEI